MNNLGKAVVGGAALAGADYLTGNVVSSTLGTSISNVSANIAANTGNILSGVSGAATPVLGKFAPFATPAAALYGAYRGYKRTKQDGIVQGVQEGSLWYAGLGTAGMLTGLTGAMPAVAGAAATGLGIYGARKAWELGKTFMEKPGENLWYGVSQPFKWSGKALKKLWNGRGAPAAA